METVNYDNILMGLIPEQLDFFSRHPGRIAVALRESSEFKFTTEEGVWVYLNGEFSHIDDNDDAEEITKEQRENGVENVVILDYYGAIMF